MRTKYRVLQTIICFFLLISIVFAFSACNGKDNKDETLVSRLVK